MFDALVTAQPSIKVHGGFQTRLEAKDWAKSNCMYGDDVYIITEDGLVVERGRIDGMWEGDADHQARIS